MSSLAAPAGTSHRLWNAIKARSELLVALFAILALTSMLIGSGYGRSSPQMLLVYALALAYVAIIIWAPAGLPAWQPLPATREGLKRAALFVWPSVLIAVIVMSVLSSTATEARPTGAFLLTLAGLLLTAVLGTIGLAMARSLPVDLFPEARRLTLRRVAYVIVAAAFLAVARMLFAAPFDNLGQAAGRALGQPMPNAQAVAAHFDGSRPLALLVNMLIGAGFIEELWFRVGIMVPVWALTRRWGLGLVVSAVAFGLYHISFSGIGYINLQWPVAAVVSSIGAGLADGLVFRYRGFAAAVLAHGLGDWIVLMLLN